MNTKLFPESALPLAVLKVADKVLVAVLLKVLALAVNLGACLVTLIRFSFHCTF